MATPTVEEIRDSILAKKAEFSSLDGLDTTSKVSSYRLWAYITAFVIWTQYQFFDLFTKETDEKIAAQLVLRDLWYRDQALAYRHGHPLVKVGKYGLGYSDEGYTDEEIESASIVKRASVDEIEQDNRKYLFIKCAKEVDGTLVKLTDAEKDGVVDYFGRIKASGTKIVVLSDDPDQLRLTVDFFYDPLVLTETGTRIDGTGNTPVQDAIRDYLRNLRFNGEFSVAELEDLIQAVPGCSDREAYVKTASANYQTPVNFQDITDVYIANSGYMEITDANLTITFKSKTVIT